MAKSISAFFIAFLFVSTCLAAEQGKDQKLKVKGFHEQMKAENKLFRESIKEMNFDEKTAAAKAFYEGKFDGQKTLSDKMRRENKNFLVRRLSRNKNLTDEQKSGLIVFFEEQQAENASFRDKQYREQAEFLINIANKPNMNFEERKAAIKFHCERQKR